MEKTGCVGSTERWHNPCKARIPLFVGDLRSLPWWKKVPLGLPQAAVELGQCLSETALPDQEQMRAGGSPGLYGNNLPCPFYPFAHPSFFSLFQFSHQRSFLILCGGAAEAMHWRQCTEEVIEGVMHFGGDLSPQISCVDHWWREGPRAMNSYIQLSVTTDSVVVF